MKLNNILYLGMMALAAGMVFASARDETARYATGSHPESQASRLLARSDDADRAGKPIRDER